MYYFDMQHTRNPRPVFFAMVEVLGVILIMCPSPKKNRNIVKNGPDVTYFWSHVGKTAANLARIFTNAATITANRV